MAVEKQTLTLLKELNLPDVQAEFNAPAVKPLSFRTVAPLKMVAKFETKIIEADGGAPLSANRVTFNSKAPLKSRKTIGSSMVELGKISMGLSLNEKEIQELNEIRAGIGGNAAAQLIYDKVYGDITICKDGADAAVEDMVGWLHGSGESIANTQIDEDGNVAGQVIKFFSDETQFGGVSKADQKFSASATADGLGEIIKAWEKTKKKARYASCDRAVVDNILLQEATKKRILSPGVFTSGQSAFIDLNLETINSYMRGRGYPQIIQVESEIQREIKKGEFVDVNPYKTNVILLHETLNFAQTLYKPKALSSGGSGVIQTQNEYATLTVKEDFNPDTVVTYVEAYVFVAPVKRKSMYFLNTENTTWNNGSV